MSRILVSMFFCTLQLVLMPILAPTFGEEKLLSLGLFFSCVNVRGKKNRWFANFIHNFIFNYQSFMFKLRAAAALQHCMVLLGKCFCLCCFFFIAANLDLLRFWINGLKSMLQVPYAAAMISILAVFGMPCVSLFCIFLYNLDASSRCFDFLPCCFAVKKYCFQTNRTMWTGTFLIHTNLNQILWSFSYFNNCYILQACWTWASC